MGTHLVISEKVISSEDNQPFQPQPWKDTKNHGTTAISGAPSHICAIIIVMKIFQKIMVIIMTFLNNYNVQCTTIITGSVNYAFLVKTGPGNSMFNLKFQSWYHRGPPLKLHTVQCDLVCGHTRQFAQHTFLHTNATPASCNIVVFN